MNYIDWDYFDKFDGMLDKYLSKRGQGDTVATQIVTAVNKLVYMWYNNGDVYDNVHSNLYIGVNNISSYANWLYAYIEPSRTILDRIDNADEDDYEEILKDLADKLLDEKFLEEENKKPRIGDIYEMEEDPFEWINSSSYDDEEDY